MNGTLFVRQPQHKKANPMNDQYQETTQAGTEIQVIPATALQEVTRSEIEQQVDTARKYPRMVSRCRDNALGLATMDQEIAAQCFYSIPRGGKKIEGPSVRLAEILGSSWTNLRYGSRVVEVGASVVTAQGVCHDLETNVAITVEVRRNILDKRGNRYGQDMITVTAQAAMSIALRNAIFKVIPRAMWEGIYREARSASLGKGTTEQKRASVLDWFGRRKVTAEQVCELAGVRAVDDLDLDRLITLRGVTTAVRDGDTTLAALLAQAAGHGEGKSTLSDALAEMKRAKAAAAATETEGAPEPHDPAQAAKAPELTSAPADAESPVESTPAPQSTQGEEVPPHDPDTGEVLDTPAPDPADEDEYTDPGPPAGEGF